MPRHERDRRSGGVAKGLYSNYFEVGHNAFEFVIEFGDTYANARRSCHTRIVMNPIYATALLDVLQRAIRRYETRFGTADEKSRAR
jgi:Protein of unknown function (DUF3467)